MVNSADAANDLKHAHALLRAGNVVHAQELCRAVLARQPDHVDALCLLGQLLVQSRHFNEAALHLRRAVALGPADSEPHEHLAQAITKTPKPNTTVSPAVIACYPCYGNQPIIMGVDL